MPKVKTTYPYRIQSIFKEFPDELWKVLTINYIAICVNCAVSCNKRFLVHSH